LFENGAGGAPDQKYRVIQREMAAERLKLADAIRPPFKTPANGVGYRPPQLAASSFPTSRFPPPWTLEENNDAASS